jgi:hypothetical protein
MIPNIFVSSTISDLQYFRDGLRDAIVDLAYNPVMSEYGEVGYINQGRASRSCYRSIKQCQMLVLIIGRRYGEPSQHGLSVTHQEFLAAQESKIPTISFVEAQVLNYKKVYEVERASPVWQNFKEMDHPKLTFDFIEAVTSSQNYNGIIPISSVAEAKEVLKRQIADFVGDRLNETIRPERSEIQEILAEIKTIRNDIMLKSKGASQNFVPSSEFLRTMRFLLEDKNADYRKFCEKLFDDIDTLIPLLIPSKNFEDLLEKTGYKLRINDDTESFQAQMRNDAVVGTEKIRFASMSAQFWYAIYSDKTIIMSQSQREKFDERQRTLHIKLTMANSAT